MAVERQFLGTKPARPAPWRDPRVRAFVYQALTLIAVVLAFAFIVDNTLTNLRRQGIAAGFGFLDRTAGFEIGFTLIPYSAVSVYGRAFLVGLLNTLLVAVLVPAVPRSADAQWVEPLRASRVTFAAPLSTCRPRRPPYWNRTVRPPIG